LDQKLFRKKKVKQGVKDLSDDQHQILEDDQ